LRIRLKVSPHLLEDRCRQVYWTDPARLAGILIHCRRGFDRVTYLDVVFSYGSLPGENELRAIDSMREVYGIRSIRFNEKERTVRVEFDASRMKQDAVAKLLRTAGIDVREPVALA
jgi:hypothetical protein